MKNWFRRDMSSFGGDLFTTRKERARRRPLSTRQSMHIVLRSTQAKGDWSFRKHRKTISALLQKFTNKFGVKLHSFANVGNHLHLHVRLGNRFAYPAFIRALTGAIALAVSGANKFKRLKKRFWDRRPFTRLVQSYAAFRRLENYVKINGLEGSGWTRAEAEFYVRTRPG